MIRNYIAIALRNIVRNISFTSVNILGLCLGMTGALVLFLLIIHITSFDKHHLHGDRIYRVVSSRNNQGRIDFTPGVPAVLPDAFRSDISGVESVLFISGQYRGLISTESNGERKMFEEGGNIGYTEGAYFQFFNRKVVRGEANLSKPNKAVISEKLANKIFGKDDAVGKVITLDNTRDFTITGIIDDYEDNTSFPFDLLMSYATVREARLQEGWGSVSSDDQCYLLLEPGKTAEEINRQLLAFNEKYLGEDNARFSERWLQSLYDIRYDTRFSNYAQRRISKESVWATGVVALFLLVTAPINFINMTTAVAVKRSKEVGIRKVLGSQRIQLIMQYLSETAIITLVSLLLSIGLAELTLLNLNVFLELDLHVDIFNFRLLMFILSVWVLVSLASGLYPAFLLSGFSPIAALKNKFTNKASGGFVLRRSLVIMQFVISQFLIIGTLVLLSQMNYLDSKDLGFTKEAIITIPIPQRDSINKKILLRDQVKQLPGVQQVSLCSTPPSSGSVSATDYSLDGTEGSYFTHVKVIDPNYLDLFEIGLLTGQGFNAIDTANQYLVNEQFLRAHGLKAEDVIGRNLRMWDRNLPVIGVVKDFHTMSLARKIEPTVLTKQPRFYFALAVKVEPGKFNSTIETIEDLWSSQYPTFLFSYEFLDEEIAQFYDGVGKMSTLLIIAACIAIVIGCLGLYGLIAFMANQKEKEIGIRKVLGATTQQIMMIFSREFTVLIIIAFFIAAPLSGMVMTKWLQNFEYKIPLQWTMFVTGVLVTLLIAFITVVYRSIKAATANPVDSLRSE